MDDLAGRDGALDGIEELGEFLVGVLRHAAADHGNIENVESGKEHGGAVALVVMDRRATFAGLQGQAGLGAVEKPTTIPTTMQQPWLPPTNDERDPKFRSSATVVLSSPNAGCLGAVAGELNDAMMVCVA